MLGPKSSGGLGVGSLASLNWALLTKWIWRFKTENDSLWRRVIGSIHRCERKPIHSWAKKSLPGTWSSIVNVFSTLGNIDIDVSDIFEFQVGDGKKILFWLDDWLKNETFVVKFPFS